MVTSDHKVMPYGHGLHISAASDCHLTHRWANSNLVPALGTFHLPKRAIRSQALIMSHHVLG